ncbi:MAG: long-chain fatty acid--CoA ligase [Thaumarchaeota archaeon]|nr:long-chain fatty acid--CoA ligase [Nitrososphaerota archaeon]
MSENNQNNQRVWLDKYPEGLGFNIDVPEQSFGDYIDDICKKYANEIAYEYQGKSFTYNEINELSNKFANALIKLGVKKGDRVALLLPNIPQFPIALYGILKAGAISVGTNFLYTPAEIESQLLDANPKIVIACTDLVKKPIMRDLYQGFHETRKNLNIEKVITTSVTDFLPGIKKRLAFVKVKKRKFDDTIDFVKVLNSSDITRPESTSVSNDIAALQYTGGTTGKSKGAMLTHKNIITEVEMVCEWVKLRENNDTALIVLPLFHIFGFIGQMIMMRSGGKVVLLPSFEEKQVLKTIEKSKITIFPGVTTMFTKLIDHPYMKKSELSSLRISFAAAMALPEAVVKQFVEKSKSPLVELYGLSETTGAVTFNPVHDMNLSKVGSIGVPLPMCDIAIVNSENHEEFCAVNEIGEIAVKGPIVMKGYWDNKEETDNMIKNGWLLTGDIGKMDEEGYFYIVDRKKDMIKVAGFNVYPRDVEDVLYENENVSEAAAVGIKNKDLSEYIKAFVVFKKGKTASEEELIEFCRTKLTGYKVPKEIEFRDELPKSLIGKILRKELKQK